MDASVLLTSDLVYKSACFFLAVLFRVLDREPAFQLSAVCARASVYAFIFDAFLCPSVFLFTYFC